MEYTQTHINPCFSESNSISGADLRAKTKEENKHDHHFSDVAHTALQRSIIDYLDKGGSFDSLMSHINNEVGEAYALHEKQVAEKKRKAEEEAAKEKSISLARGDFLDGLLVYLNELGIIDDEVITEEMLEGCTKVLKNMESEIKDTNTFFNSNPLGFVFKHGRENEMLDKKCRDALNGFEAILNAIW